MVLTPRRRAQARVTRRRRLRCGMRRRWRSQVVRRVHRAPQLSGASRGLLSLALAFAFRAPRGETAVTGHAAARPAAVAAVGASRVADAADAGAAGAEAVGRDERALIVGRAWLALSVDADETLF